MNIVHGFIIILLEFFSADHLLLLLLDWSTKLQWVKHEALMGFGMVVKDKLKIT